MRLVHRFKYYNNTNFLYKTYPVKILESFKEKWKFLIRKLVNLATKKKRFRHIKIKNYLKTRVPMRTFENYERHYNTELVQKRLFYLMYQKSVDSKYLAKERLNTKLKTKEAFVQFKLVSPFFRLDVLAWYLSIVSSTYEVKALVQSGYIELNDRLARTASFLSKGDVSCFNLPSTYNTNRWLLSNIRHKYKKPKRFFFFLEVDYYLRSFVLIEKQQFFGKQSLLLTEQ